MRFNTHSHLAGFHAFLSASKYSWLGYDDERLDQAYHADLAKKKGDELHAFAKEAIRLRQRLIEDGSTMSLYVNDAIGFGMVPEQVLFYSENAFSTADAIGFRKETSKLRIHDLKTGQSRTSMNQLEINAAHFCLEYDYNPFEIEIELRIYQARGIRVHEPTPDTIMHIMDRTRHFDKRIKQIRREALS